MWIAITMIIGSVISGFFTQVGVELYHFIKNTTIHISIQIQPLSFFSLIPVIIGIAGFSLLCYDIMESRRNRNDQKAQSKERVKNLEDGEPDTEPF